MSIAKPIPRIFNEQKEYWAAARSGTLLQQRCRICGTFSAPYVEGCWNCHAGIADIEWREVSGRGVIHTYNVYHRAYHPGFGQDVPYNTAIVELDEGPLLPTRIVECDNSELRVGMPVEVVFVPHDSEPDIVLPMFRPVREGRRF